MLEENRQDPLPIPNATLKRPKIFNKDVLGTKHDFQQIGGNEFLQIEPSIAKFTGFEINKLNILKLRVINKASVAQRIHVLPSKKENNVFQVKMMKKGQLAPGMNEDIFIHFRPSEYRYYYDTLRINSETCNLVIPIHAYPVPNRQELREQFPKIIDFGTVDIGEQQVIRQQLKSRIPLNFEYEFVFTKNENDISIQPIKGIIPGNGQIDIDLIYQPTNNATVVANVELRLSQFDYEPLNIKLIGNGRYPNPSDLKNKMKLEPINRQTNSQYFGLKSNQSNFVKKIK
ncbi:hypothetical protein PPERSA_10649 [Pseudocohnilembus persalinus]|uniref:Uncharacterized protein n=1 Tax=Pseudocohnilembus persalinus TaxID=266149 RepID=A0A0V0QDA6_PSEPJ|nr:hypothetical protein PPERSA_10649 [Pseudocohnilembus persalinus]|eukprot:KRX00150.1 hypothetical protein PPERSA_10649 [Pseudocohnilembus persalinus]